MSSYEETPGGLLSNDRRLPPAPGYGLLADEECPKNLVKLVGAEQVAVLNLDDGSIVVREPTERERFMATTGYAPPKHRPQEGE